MVVDVVVVVDVELFAEVAAGVTALSGGGVSKPDGCEGAGAATFCAATGTTAASTRKIEEKRFIT